MLLEGVSPPPLHTNLDSLIITSNILLDLKYHNMNTISKTLNKELTGFMFQSMC